MSNEHGHSQPKMLIVPSDILQVTGFTMEQLSYHLNKLRSFLGPCFEKIIPSQINDSSTIEWAVDLSQRLEKLSHCKGFSTHVSCYSSKNAAASAYDVAVIATYLHDMVDSIELEPIIEGEKHRPDILINYKGERVYLECKSIDTQKFSYFEEHRRMFSILRSYMVTPHQIDIQYKSPLSDAELHDLGKVIQERLGLITTSGNIIHNSNIRVSVQMREPNSRETKGPLGMMLGGISEDLRDQCFYPLHVYMEGSVTLSLSGPKVDYSKILRGKLGKSRRQSPYLQPYVVVINCNNMVGSWTDNIRAISSAFQPSRNTRISAVLLVRYNKEPRKKELTFKFEMIPNPFTKAVLSERFKGLFKS